MRFSSGLPAFLVSSLAVALAVASSTPWTTPAWAESRDPLIGEINANGGGSRLPILVPVSRRDEWAGGTQSLPYGDHVDPAAVTSAARNLAVTQPALAEFASRGYLRRPDLDHAEARRGYAVAVLAFEKPGMPTGDALACIEVVTQALRIDGADWPATQVFGGVLRDSAGVVVPGDPALDTPLIVVPDTGAETAGALPDPIDENFVFKYSAREGIGEVHVQASMSPGALKLYNAEARSVLNAEMEGAILGIPLGGGGVAFGAVIGMVFADRQFWITPPDTCGCGQHAFEAPADLSAAHPPARRESASPAFLTARVLDAQGRVIRELGRAWIGADTRGVLWDGRDASGRPAAAGVYFVVAQSRALATHGAPLVRRVIVTR